MGAALGLGFIVGPARGRILGATDPPRPFGAAGAISLVNALRFLGSHPQIGSLAVVGVFSVTVQGGLTRPTVKYLGQRRTPYGGAHEQGQLQGATASLPGIAGLVEPALFTLGGLIAWRATRHDPD